MTPTTDSQMAGNRFAESLETYADPRNSLDATALMALAFEQRTANLIAFERSQWEAWRRDELTPEGEALYRKAAKQITERLGLA